MHALQRLTAIFLCTSVGWRGSRVVAQIIYPPCNNITGMQWAFNKENQNPCQVGDTLEGSCFENRWDLSPIIPGQEYGGPSSPLNSNICQCNTVVYSLISACGACQNGPFPTWTQWRTNCSETNVTIANFPNVIPSGTDVPAWAYLNVTRTDSWNKDAALANATSGTTTITTTTPTTPTATGPGSSSTATTGDNTTSSSSKAGPIAGGVVGGVIGLAALALAGFIWYRRSYRPKHPTQHRDEKVEILNAPSPVSGPGPDFYGHFRSPSDGPPPKIYNPSDPSTFPPSLSPVPPGYTPQSPVGSAFSGQTGSAHGGVWAPMGYKGAPEV